jgi:hypothetical protein
MPPAESEIRRPVAEGTTCAKAGNAPATTTKDTKSKIVLFMTNRFVQFLSFLVLGGEKLKNIVSSKRRVKSELGGRRMH